MSFKVGDDVHVNGRYGNIVKISCDLFYVEFSDNSGEIDCFSIHQISMPSLLIKELLYLCSLIIFSAAFDKI